jgi:PAS domain S-box-containing protein
MDLDRFTRELEAMRQRVADLHDQTADVPVQRMALKLAFAELDKSLEELRAAEEELRVRNQDLLATQQVLEAERRRYQDLFKGAPDGYLVTNLAGIIQSANRAAATLFNLPPQGLIGLPLANFVPREDRRRFRDELQQVRRFGRRTDWDVRLQPYQGQVIEVALSATAERDHKGYAVALRWLLRDITERKRLEEAAHASRIEAERLAELDRLRRDFILSVSHSLRTPLTAIQAGLGMLETSSPDRLRPDEQQLVGNIRRNSERLRMLIDHLLTLNQLGAGALQLNREPLDLRAIVMDAILAVYPLLQKKGQALKLDLPEPLPTEGDA